MQKGRVFGDEAREEGGTKFPGALLDAVLNLRRVLEAELSGRFTMATAGRADVWGQE